MLILAVSSPCEKMSRNGATSSEESSQERCMKKSVKKEGF
jgi:hypothetical protein